MLFNKNEERANERVLYKTKPNMILGCKKTILGVILLVIVFIVSPRIIRFIGDMQVYLISRITLPLTRYAAIGFFVVILVIVIYMMWQIIRWYSIEYTLTDTRIIIKSGVLSTKKNYMPYRTIQDINTSQSIFARLFNVGTVSAYSAYDNNQISLENISNPSEVEDIIFSNMVGYGNFPEPPRNYIDENINRSYPQNRRDNFPQKEEYFDEYEPITPIRHERESYSRREYEYYPEDFNYQEDWAPKYEYEPYDDNFDRVINRSNENIRFEGQNSFSNKDNYNEVRDDYSYRDDDYYQENANRIPHDEGSENSYQNEEKQVDESSEKVIRRHFDKFKK